MHALMWFNACIVSYALAIAILHSYNYILVKSPMYAHVTLIAIANIMLYTAIIEPIPWL